MKKFNETLLVISMFLEITGLIWLINTLFGWWSASNNPTDLIRQIYYGFIWLLLPLGFLLLVKISQFIIALLGLEFGNNFLSSSNSSNSNNSSNPEDFCMHCGTKITRAMKLCPSCKTPVNLK